jgi:type IV pilus assembly protein PilQ
MTLHLTNVDIRDFLNLIHELSGRNIVVDSNVRGRVTAIMNDVTWEQALAAVLKANHLAGTVEGNIYRVTTEKTAPLEICTYQLSNANASDVARMIEPFLSRRGRVAADARTDTLIVSDVPAVLETLGVSPVPASKGRCGPPTAH